MYNDFSLNREEQRHFMQEACYVATNSPDPSTQNGSVLISRKMMGDEDIGFQLTPYIVAKGCNTFPRGVKNNFTTKDRWERPVKYSFVEHAERNSIFDAAKNGVRTHGLIMVCPWAACADCARAIIQSGIRELITLAPEEGDSNPRWDSSIGVAMTMLEEAEIKVTYLDGKVFDAFNQVQLRRNGEAWLP